VNARLTGSLATTLATLLLAQPVFAEDRNAAIANLMISTKLIAVGDWDKPTSAFVEDNDPNTLEIVFLKDANTEASRVSDDGEVIFLNAKVTDDEQQTLTLKAMNIRYDKRNQKP
jgi:hypothetical protein